MTTETPEDCEKATEAIHDLKTCLGDTIEARTKLVQALKGLLAHQRAAAEEEAKEVAATEVRLDTAQGIKHALEALAEGGDEGQPAKRSKAN